MKPILAALLLIMPIAAAADTYAYVSVADQSKIAVYRVDDAGRLTRSGELAVPGTPGALGVDPANRFLFSSLRSISSLASFRIDPANGALSSLSTVPTGVNAAFVGTDRSGRFVLSASYQAGKVMVHALGRDGMIAREPSDVVETAQNAHLIVAAPGNRAVFVPHTGPNAIFQFRFDEKTGKLTPNNPAKVTTPENTGPRHLRFHPTRPLAYVANENGSSVSLYRLDETSGTLTPLQTLSTLPAGFSGSNTCAEVKVHPTGRFVYVSNRGHDSIASFTADESGRLTATGHAPTEKTPRSFDLDPTGRFLFAAGEGSGKLACYRIDSQTGLLTRFDTVEVGKQLTWVQVVPVGRRN